MTFDEASKIIKKGDIILGLAESPVTGVDDLHRLLSEELIGVSSPLVVIRSGERRTMPVVPVESARG